MVTKKLPIPEGFRGATPYLCCRDAARAIEFYKKAFGATEVMRLADPTGKVGHAEIRIGEAMIMLADEHPEFGFRSPLTYGGSPVGIHVYVDDVDSFFKQATAAGATMSRPPTDQFYGDRSGSLTDPFGHVWHFATHTEDVSPQELQRRYAAMTKQ